MHLTQEQRYTISILLEKDYSLTKIAQFIGKDKSVISRELKRNRDSVTGNYNADLAQQKYIQRQKEKLQKKRFTDDVKEYVKEKLLDDWSPEQISQRGKKDHIECVSHETIYKFVWADKRNGGELHKHLRRQGRRYRKRGNLKDSRGIIKNRVSIDERPKIVDEKKRFGDFEIDTIIGRNHKGAILSINDRWSSLVWIRKLTGKNAKELTIKAVEALKDIRDEIYTITADNGKEFALHEIISKRFLLPILDLAHHLSVQAKSQVFQLYFS